MANHRPITREHRLVGNTDAYVSHSDTHTISLGIFLLLAALFHMRPALFGKLDRPKQDDHATGDESPTNP